MGRLVNPEWYRYLSWRLGRDGRIVLGMIVLIGAGVGGFFATRAIASSNSADAQTYVRLTATVTKVVHVRDHGRVVVRRVPVVKRIYAKPVTVLQRTTVTAPGGTRVVTKPVVRYKPVYRRTVVTVRGKPVTVDRLVTSTQMLTDTQLLTVTNTLTRTRTRTETSPPVTVTVTGPTQTVTVRRTITVTATLPPTTTKVP